MHPTDQTFNRHKARMLSRLEESKVPRIIIDGVAGLLDWLKSDIRIVWDKHMDERDDEREINWVDGKRDL